MIYYRFFSLQLVSNIASPQLRANLKLGSLATVFLVRRGRWTSLFSVWTGDWSVSPRPSSDIVPHRKRLLNRICKVKVLLIFCNLEVYSDDNISNITRTWSPACGPSLWKSIGRHHFSSFIRLEFWKWAIKAFLPWILAYASDATFSLLNFSHFLPLNVCTKPPSSSYSPPTLVQSRKAS